MGDALTMTELAMNEPGTQEPATPVPPTTVGPFTVLLHMLFGVVGLLAAGIGAAWWWAGDELFGADERPALLSTAPPGSVGVGGGLDAVDAAVVGSALLHGFELAHGGPVGLVPGNVDFALQPFGVAEVRSVLLEPTASPEELEIEVALEEFALLLAGIVGRPVNAIEHAFPGSGAPSVVPMPLVGGINANAFLTEDEIETIYVQYQPPGGGAVLEWRAEVDGGTVRFVAR